MWLVCFDLCNPVKSDEQTFSIYLVLYCIGSWEKGEFIIFKRI